jgi:predicted CxxxxCH...CXXCH cytochrome family protein
MINQTVKLFIVAALMLIPSISFALPGPHDPTTGGNGYLCNSCHISGKNVGKLDAQFAQNVCLVCHSTGDPKTKKQFTVNDFANIYQTTALPQGNAKNTSHKWFGPDSVTAAGAMAPVDDTVAGLNKAGYTGSLACNRCHSVHGTSGDQSTKAPYLRMANDSDQMCRNCHRLRDTTDHKTGSHPVNVSYSSAVNANKLAASPTKTTFLTTPVVNTVNRTGQVKLTATGSVVCSTCHGVHNTDSRTSTFDPYSSSHTFGQLSSSKGYLLRVDAFGKTENDVNICTNCHVAKNHNIKPTKIKPSVQCNDCHSGHVEYDAAATGGELTPNVYLVRRYLQYSTAGRSSKKMLYRSTTVKEFYNSTKNGVCQTCHTPPANHFSGGTTAGTFPENSHANCAGCHNHAEPAGSFSYGTSGGCSNTCHGLPPTASAVGGPNGKAYGYTRFDEGATPHSAHAAGGGANANDFDCVECHKGYVMENGNFTEVFSQVSPLAGATASYTISGSKCNNVYCHSNGNGVWKTGMNPISWSSPKGSIVGQANECKACHDDPESTASHNRHNIDMNYGCVTCHAATVLNNTTLLASAKAVGGTHLNGLKELQFSQLGAAVGAPVGTTCANVKCHSNGKGGPPVVTPSWANPLTGKCGTCHLTQLSTVVLSSGSHTKHFSIIGGNDPLVVCAKCHNYVSETAATHVNGTVEPTTGCNSCHSSPYSSDASTPAWGSAPTASGCGQCHTGVGAFTGAGQGPNTGSHNKHMALALALCNQCHAGASAGSTGGLAHLNTYVDVTVGSYPANVVKHTAGSGYSTCSTAACHASPYSTVAIITTPSWGVSAGCATCHTGVGAFTGTGSSPVTGSHTKHMSLASPACNQCHTGTVAGSNGGTAHLDGNIDVIGGYTANVTKHTYNNLGFSSCSAASCHLNPYSSVTPSVTPVWGAVGGCVSCHSGAGAFTGVGQSPVTGSHTKHIGVGATCGACHTGAVAGSTGGAAHLDNNIDVIGGYTANVTKHTLGSGYSSCNASVCHGSASPVWGVSTTNDYCTKCHGTNTVTVSAGNRYVVAPSLPAGTDTGNVSSNVKTGAHQTHLQYLNGFSNYSTVDYRCEACHGTLPASNTFTHADGTSSPVGKYKNLATNWGKMTGQTYVGQVCSNTYCHNPAGPGGTLNLGNTGSGIAPSWTNTNYITNGTKKTYANCNTCHKTPGNVGFVGYYHAGSTSDVNWTVNNSCSGCHGHNGDTAGIAGQRHMDGIKHGGGVNCNDCHGYPPMSAADLVGTGVSGNYFYAKLENTTGVGGGHHKGHLLPTLDIAEGSTPCLPCHPFAGQHDQNGGVVLRANVQVNDAADTGYRFDPSRSKRYNTTTKTCSNISCHFQPTAAW